MDFNIDKPIFRQIVDLCHRKIMDGEWLPGCKVPSVRELAVELSVNTRTVLSAYDVLEQEGLVVTKRGLGCFLADAAGEIVLRGRRSAFFNEELPRFMNEMLALGITPDEIIEIMEQNETSNNR